MSVPGRDSSFVHQAYWIVLGRAASALELSDEHQGHLNADQLTVLRGLLTTPEFRRRRCAWKEGREPHADAAAVERALVSLGPDGLFIRRVYESLLGRAPDAGGAQHYNSVLSR